MLRNAHPISRLGLPLLIALGAILPAAARDESGEGAAAGMNRLLLRQGEWLFQKNCAFCHERDGRGSVGPNLTDWYFLYGPTRQNMRLIIENGVLPRGMPVWKEMLSSAELRAVEEYVWSLRGQELDGKEPQGGYHGPEEAVAAELAPGS